MAGDIANKKPVTNKWSLAFAETPSVVLGLYNHLVSAKLFYHSYSFCRELSDLVYTLSNALDLSEEEKSKAGIYAWFYATGKLTNYSNPEIDSHNFLNKLLKSYSLSLSSNDSDNIYLNLSKQIESEEEWINVLKDAVTAMELGLNGNFDWELKKLQDDFNLASEWNNTEWEYYKLQQLLEARFITQEAKSHFEQVLAKKILLQKSVLEKYNKDNKSIGAQAKPKRDISSRRLQANIQSFLRVGFRNHIELTKMADTRAHIMISVNSILTGALVSFISYQNLPETHPKLLIPVGVFMITSLTSLIFAILCARPRFIRSIKSNSPEELINENLASFSNFTLLSIEEYENAIDHVFSDNYLMVTNLKRELYNTGKILDTKYKFLGFSYNIFMFGFVSCVVLFMIIYLLG